MFVLKADTVLKEILMFIFAVGSTLSQAKKALRESRGIALLYFRPPH